nr:MAG TPA: hypothetical protein [Caudoviricetes sp.]
MYRIRTNYEQIKIGIITIILCTNPVNGRLLTIVSNP